MTQPRRVIRAPQMPTAGGTPSPDVPAQSGHSAQPVVGPTATLLRKRVRDWDDYQTNEAKRAERDALLAEGEPSTGQHVPAESDRPSPSASKWPQWRYV